MYATQSNIHLKQPCQCDALQVNSKLRKKLNVHVTSGKGLERYHPSGLFICIIALHLFAYFLIFSHQ